MNAPTNISHADRVLAKYKVKAAELRRVLPGRRDEEPNHGPLYDDHDVATIRAAAWDGSL